jgi:hypothetical protein
MDVIDRETEKRHKKLQRAVQPGELPCNRQNHPELKAKSGTAPSGEGSTIQKKAGGRGPTMKNVSISYRSDKCKAIVEVPLDMPQQIIVHQEFSDE